MEQRYNVITTGALAPGRDVRTVKENLIRMFKMSEVLAERLVGENQFIVKKDVDLAAAKNLRAALEKAGLLSLLDPPPPAAPADPPPQTMYTPASRPGAATARTTGVEVTPRFFPILVELLFWKPVVEIDGVAHEVRWWERRYFPLTPGEHTITIYFRYFRRPDCGLNSRKITVAAGGAYCKIEYFMWPWMYARGSMWVSNVTGCRGLQPGRSATAQAGFGRRLGAACIDGLIIGLFIVLLAVILAYTDAKSPRVDPVLFVVIHGSLWLYYALLESSSLQATVGKKLLYLQVTDGRGSRISLGKATLRHLARIFLLGFSLGLGFLLILFTARKQGLHDLATGTLVKSI